VKRYGGNVHDRTVVEVTGSRPASRELNDTTGNAVDLGTDSSYFWSADEKGQSICLNFREMKMRPTHYSFQSNGDVRNAYHLRSWVVEGSQDGSPWTVIDCREENNDLNHSDAGCTFAVSRLDR
jgi:hypothetical protein